MAVRFRKSFKLAPGVRMNLSGGGLSWTLGPRGASVGIGKRGSYLNAGLPGTGLSVRQALHACNGSQPRRTAPATQKTQVSLSFSVGDDGTITFTDHAGRPVPESMVTAAKRQEGDVIMGEIHQKCAEINGQVSALGELHLDTPDPAKRLTFQPSPYTVDPPRPPERRVPGFIDRLFKSRRKRIEDENAAAEARHVNARDAWAADKARFEQSETKRVAFLNRALTGDPEAMEECFENVLSDIVWPRETEVSFEVRDAGRKLVFDVDLPEIEDMPTKTATMPQRGYRLSVKEMGQTAVQKLYAQHVHSIAFRLIGEAFGMLPTLNEVTLSGYTQRKDKATGHSGDQYVLSIVVSRSAWAQVNFAELRSLDVIEALARFELRREMSKTGIFKPVTPL